MFDILHVPQSSSQGFSFSNFSISNDFTIFFVHVRHPTWSTLLRLSIPSTAGCFYTTDACTASISDICYSSSPFNGNIGHATNEGITNLNALQHAIDIQTGSFGDGKQTLWEKQKPVQSIYVLCVFCRVALCTSNRLGRFFWFLH